MRTEHNVEDRQHRFKPGRVGQNADTQPIGGFGQADTIEGKL